MIRQRSRQRGALWAPLSAGGGGGVGGWPAALDVGLVCRFDASVPESFTLDGGGAHVAAWADLGSGGRSLTRTGTGTSPSYDATALAGGPCVVFDWSAAQQLLYVGGAPYNAGSRVTAVAVYERHPGLWGSVLLHQDNSGTGISIQDDAGGSDGAVRSHSNNDAPRVGFSSTNGAQVLLAVLGTSSYVQRNGVDVTASATTGSPPGCGSSGRLSIGRDPTRFASFGPRRVGFVAAWQREVTGDDLSTLYAYLAARWTT